VLVTSVSPHSAVAVSAGFHEASGLPGGAAPRHVSLPTDRWGRQVVPTFQVLPRCVTAGSRVLDRPRPWPHARTTRSFPRTIKGSSGGTREIPDLRSSHLPQGRAHGTSVEGSGHDQSGRSKLGSQQSPRHGPTRRCSGRAAAGSEQPQASRFVCGSSLPPRPHAAELHWLGC